MIRVTIAAITQETPTVRSFKLVLSGQTFQFLPGQWLDCYLDPQKPEIVAGYSMTSTPADTEFIELAVKRVGINPVTHYLHESATVDDTLYLDGGYGDFYYKPGSAQDLLLIAGGIGLTPLMSIVRFVARFEPRVQTTLVHSVHSADELLYRKELGRLAANASHIHYVPRVTESGEGRIGRKELEEFDKKRPVFYLCGPQEMVDGLNKDLRSMHVPSERIKFERW
ncbi:MAG: oxidoreductase [Dehalococcoidia bacterium]|nr:oxidoreductase [Dehalococcoidia bacterium]